MLKDFVATESLQTENFCGGCGAAIRDRYYLLAADQAWHGQCLRCCKCSQPLDSELSCYSREDNIYCKEDYYRLFSSKRCGGCGKGLRSSELVMRARDLVFHVNCFSCSLCGIRLSAGDTAAISCGRLLCGEHYDGEISSEENSISTAGPFYSNSPQKGRPRKRNLSSADHSDESHDTNAKDSTSMRTEFLHGDFASSSFSLTSYEDSQSPGSSSNLSGQGRTKRMRTSFKHHQLRTMKSYFSINQNPDAKDLKQLAQKTGLSKRVLQVWFQNARAKWRRNIMLREVNQTQPSSSGSILPNDTTLTSSFTTSTDTSQTQDLESIHHLTFGKLY